MVALLSATFTNASAKDNKECKKAKTECSKADKKSKKNKKECKKGAAGCCKAPVALLSMSDSLSYAAGMTYTTGLMEYVGKQYGVDSTSMDAFVAGLREGIKRSNDKQFMAHSAGVQIAQMLETRMYPGVANEVKNTQWTLDSINFNRGFIDAVVNDTTVMKAADAKKFFENTMTTEKRRQEDAYKKENTDWLAANAKKEGVKAIFAPVSISYAQLIIDQATAQGVNVPILGSDTWDTNTIFEVAKGKDIDIYVSTFYQEGANPEFEKGIKEWINADSKNLENNGGNDMLSAVTVMGYDAYMVALEAIKAAGSTDPAAVMAALPGVTYEGISGHIEFNETGDANRDSAYIKSVNTETGAWDFVKVQKAS